MPYCMYLRKSRKDIDAEQQGAGETLARHRATLAALARRRGLIIDKIYQEIVSGDTISDRPIMQQLLADVQAGMWDAVLVMEVERLARGDTIDQGIVAQSFKFSNTIIITPSRDYDPNNESDEEYFEFGLFMSRREYKTTRRRLQAGRIASVREGKYMGSRAPFGYERYKLVGEKGWSLRIVPKKAEIVRSIFRWYLHGEDVVDPSTGKIIHRNMGAQLIANRLNAMGVTTDLGHAWTGTRIRSMLREPCYVGKVQWYQRETKVAIVNGQRVRSRPRSDKYMLVEGRHEAIIDADTWNGVQNLFDGRKKQSVSVKRDMQNPLNGIVKCSVCGKAMVRTPMYAHLAGVDYLKCSTSGCATSSSPLAGVENLILDGLRAWVKHVDVADVPAEAFTENDTTSMRELAKRHIDELEKRRVRLMDLLESGVYDADTYAQRSALLAQDVAAAKHALAEIPQSAPSRQSQIAAILPDIKHVLQAYAVAPTNEDKNNLLRSVLDKVIYTKTRAGKRGENSTKYVTLDMFPRTK